MLTFNLRRRCHPDVTVTLSYMTFAGAFVAVLPNELNSPTVPALCRLAVLSVAVSCGLAGSVPPAFHTVPLREVDVPLLATLNRTRIMLFTA